VRKWDVVIAIALADAARQRDDDPFKLYPHHLQVKEDCYDRFGNRRRAYEVQDIDNTPIPGGVTRFERIYVVSGGKSTSINTPFRGTRFIDTINKNLMSNWTFYQQFSVSITGLNATPGAVPIMVREMNGQDYGTLGFHIDK
jgi:hypothetical protein